jgi:2'-5' RNA ligase
VIRAFIAVTLDSKVIDKIAQASARLQGELVGLRWVAPANFHLTLKFLGSVDEAKVGTIRAALSEQLRLFPRFTINAKGLGVFPGPKRPRVLWVGLSGERLVPLASTVETALQPLGFAPELRKFTPHLTIGRWRDTGPAPKSLVRQLDEWKACEFGISHVKSVSLIQSIIKPGGASYYHLATVLLDAERPNDKARLRRC